MTFNELELNSSILRALEEMEIYNPTEIQEKSIPLLLSNTRDFVGQAQTGTGKTAAFVIPVLQKLDAKSKHIQVLVMAPTRELAQQVEAEVKKLVSTLALVVFVFMVALATISKLEKLKKIDNHI